MELPIRDRNSVSSLEQQYDLYSTVKFSDVATKTLTVGGINNSDGIIEVKDSNKKTVVRIDKDGNINKRLRSQVGYASRTLTVMK